MTTTMFRIGSRLDRLPMAKKRRRITTSNVQFGAFDKDVVDLISALPSLPSVPEHFDEEEDKMNAAVSIGSFAAAV